MPRNSAHPVLRIWLFYFTIGAWVLAALLLVIGRPAWVLVGVVMAIAAGYTSRVWSRKSPIPMPYSMRWILRIPRGPQSPQQLERTLLPRSGERILEIGAGIGIHALLIARQLLPDGILDVLDVQPAMLEALTLRAKRAGVTNIVPILG